MSEAGARTRANAVITVGKYEPAAYDEPAEGPVLTRIHVEESFSGDISGDGVVEFLQAGRADGSASFVGIERVTGTLGGRTGTFLLQDAGTVAGTLVSGDWFVIPGSGTGGPACAARAASVPTSARVPRCTSITGSNSHCGARSPGGARAGAGPGCPAQGRSGHSRALARG